MMPGRSLPSPASGAPGRACAAPRPRTPTAREAEHRLFSFLTCDANGIVGPVHPKAMPVLLTTPEEWWTWLEAPTEIALELQRPLPDAMMKVVATGARRDPAE